MKPTSVLVSDSATIAIIHERLRKMGSYTEGEFFDTLVVEDGTLGVDGSNDVLLDYEAVEVDLFRSRFGDVAALLFEHDRGGCFERVARRATRGLEGIVDDNSGKLKDFADLR